MKRRISLLLAVILALSCFCGCEKTPEVTEPTTEPIKIDSQYGILLEDANGVEYESAAQKAVIKTALAYLARRTRIQYDDTRLTGAGTPVMYRWQNGVRKSPEEYTSQYTGYTNCAAFTYDVYLAALNMKIDGYTTKNLTSVSGKQRIYSYYPKGTETEEQMEQVRESFLSKLKPADLIIIRYNGAKDGNGHAMLYVGKDVLRDVEGAKENHDIIHSTGGSYQYGDKMEKYEKNGTVQTMSTTRFFDSDSSLYLFGKLKSIVILRPLEVFKKEIPQNTLNRMKYLDNVMVEKISSHSYGVTANPGDTVTFTFLITNKNTEPVTLQVEDTLSELATFRSGEGCTQEGDRLRWEVTVPANTTVPVTYDVQVKADAQVGKSLAGDQGTVGGVSAPCPDVFIARTLTQQEQSDLLAAVDALADSRILRGSDLVNALYSKTLKVEDILPNDVNGILDSLYPNLAGVAYIDGKSIYADAIAPGLFGGRMVIQRTMAMDNVAQYMRLEAIRTRLPDEEQLVVGDILVARDVAEETVNKMYLYTGSNMLDLLSGRTVEYVETESCLNSAIAYTQFAIIRPSMLLDKEA